MRLVAVSKSAFQNVTQLYARIGWQLIKRDVCPIDAVAVLSGETITVYMHRLDAIASLCQIVGDSLFVVFFHADVFQ